MTAKRRGRTASDRRPEAPWGRVWIAGLALTLVGLGVWEMFWRSRGWLPTASDPAAWTMVRSGMGSNQTVLLGSSRMQADVDPTVWARATGGPEPAMLAMFGTIPTPALEHLAETEDFAGTVIVDWIPGFSLDPEESTAGVDAMIEAWERSGISPGRWLDTRLGHAMAPELVFRRPVLSLRSLLETSWDRAWPRSAFLWPSRGMRRNRFFPMEFENRGGEAAAPRDLEGLTARAWDDGHEQMFERVEAATRTIQERGGAVVFVRFPSCGGRRASEERVFPRSDFWDRFADRTSGRAIHFEDTPSLRGFECPDGSHLDVRDTERFTAALAKVVVGS